MRTLIGRKFHISYSVSGANGCRTGWAAACRCRPGPAPSGPGPAPSATRTRSPRGRRRPGGRQNPSGGDRRVHLLRGRSGCDRPSARGPHLGPARDHPDRGRLRAEPGPARRR
ncbi:hypothetical protein ACKI2D_46190 [Streptomyces europaeiscabiei]|uniref:hypothetical protein n=1 Tax=Streptomyces europaeiscabiei TaxID=146819 RepID=UPI0038F737F4